MLRHVSRPVPWLLYAIGIVVVVSKGNAFTITVGMLTCLSIAVASAMNVVMGYGGLINLGIGTFYGVGAYTTAILSTRHGMGIWWDLLISMGISGILALLMGPFILRTRGLYFAIGTLAIGAIGSSLATNWVGLTGGPIGISGVSRPGTLGFIPVSLQSLKSVFVAIAVVTALILLTIALIARGRFGRMLVAVREDETLAVSLGNSALGYKVGAFATSAVLASVAGVMYALAIQYVSPTPFTFLSGSFQAFVIVAVGGGGTVWGPVVGALFLVAVPDYLNFSPNTNQYIYAVALLIVVVALQGGIVPGVRKAIGLDLRSKRTFPAWWPLRQPAPPTPGAVAATAPDGEAVASSRIP